MRVLLATESYLPYLSGVTVSVDALARGLGALGHEVVVLAPEPAPGALIEPVGSPGPEPSYAWLRSYQPPAVAPAGYRMPSPLRWGAAMGTARRFAPHVVHAHSPFVTGLLARRLARSLGVPLAFTHHTRFADYRHYAGPLAPVAGRLADAYLRRFWAGCAAIVAPSTDLAAEIDAGRRRAWPRGGGPGVHVIPTGVDVAGIRAMTPIDARSRAGWERSTVVVASLGRLAPEKSPLTLVEAFALAARRAPSLRLLVVGGGPSEADVRGRAARADLAGRVLVAGPRPRQEALALLKGADLFAFASRTETQGLVLAEALAAGLPAVALAGPGVADSVRDGIDGLVVARDARRSDAECLAEGLVALAADGVRRERLASAAAADASRFSLERRAGEMEELYRALVG